MDLELEGPDSRYPPAAYWSGDLIKTLLTWSSQFLHKNVAKTAPAGYFEGVRLHEKF